jgi:peptidoglycan-N-acetylglucosamine deacetylase
MRLSITLLLFGLVSILVPSCDEVTPPAVNRYPGGGIVLTFDDDAIDGWRAADSVLTPFRWKATFCVSGFPSLDTGRVATLLALQSGGHEIACHGTVHLDAEKYLTAHPFSAYLDTEIFPALSRMTAAGFRVSSFAYPFGSRTHASDSGLLRYFSMLRGSARMEFDCFASGDRTVFAAQCDGPYATVIPRVSWLLDIAKANDRVLLLTAHRPVAEDTGAYSVGFRTLEKICSLVTDRKVRFLTLRDLREL